MKYQHTFSPYDNAEAIINVTSNIAILRTMALSQPLRINIYQVNYRLSCLKQIVLIDNYNLKENTFQIA